MVLFWLVAGYLLGSVPTGYIATKMIKGVDIRMTGSGNIGATNAGRVLGKKWAILIGAFDMLKGGVIVLIASFFTSDPLILALTGAMSVLGHDYPVWLNFHGGKGVATTLGVFAFYNFFNPYPALIGCVTWYLVLKKTKYIALASIIGIFAGVLSMPIFDMPKEYYATALLLAVLSMWRHRSNIRHLRAGVEEKSI